MLTYAHIWASGSSRPRPARQAATPSPAALPPAPRPLPLPLASTRRAVWDSTPVQDGASRPKRVALPSGHQARDDGRFCHCPHAGRRKQMRGKHHGGQVAGENPSSEVAWGQGLPSMF